MPPRGNAWVVEEGHGVDSVQERLHRVMGKECQTNIKTIKLMKLPMKDIELG